MNGRIATVLVVIGLVGLVLAGCGSGAKHDVVADANTSFGRVQRGAVHLKVAFRAADDQTTAVGFDLNGVFDLALPDTELPALDTTTANLGTPGMAATHFVCTGTDGYIVRGETAFKLGPAELEPLRLQPADRSSSGADGRPLRPWMVDPVAQPSTTTASGERVDRVVGQFDPVAGVNKLVDFAAALGGSPDGALRIANLDAPAVKAAIQSSQIDVLIGHDDHLLRSVSARVELAAPRRQTTSGGALLHAIDRFGHVTLTVELGIDRPNAPVTISAPAHVEPISELRSG